MFTLTTQDLHGVADNDMIRKLMPIECWRLQGFTDEQFNKARAAGLSDARLQTFLKLFVNSLPMIL